MFRIYLVVNDGINCDGDAVLRQNLLRGDVERDSTQIRNDDLKRTKISLQSSNKITSRELSKYLIHARNDEEEPGANGASLLDPAEPEDDGSLVFL